MTQQAVAPDVAPAGPTTDDVRLLTECVLRDAEEVLTGHVKPGWAEHATRRLSEHGLIAGTAAREWTPRWVRDTAAGSRSFADNGMPVGATNRLYIEVRPFDTGRAPTQAMIVAWPGPDMRCPWFSVPIPDRGDAERLAGSLLGASRHLGMLDSPTLDALLRVAHH